jgi:hypothetical protein
VSDGARLLLDEMLSGEIAVQLRVRGWGVVAVVEDPALVGTPDEDLLTRATGEGRSIVTANVRDFAAISTQWRARGREHAGLVHITTRTFPQDRSYVGAIVAALDSLLRSGRAPSAGSETFLRRRDS